MATTFVGYHGPNVMVSEALLIKVGSMLFHEGLLASRTEEEIAHFSRMARGFERRQCGVGCTDLGLEELLAGDKQKEEEFLGLVKLARKRLASFGDTIPADYVNQFMPDPEYRGDWENNPWLGKMLDLIELLVRRRPIPESLADLRRW